MIIDIHYHLAPSVSKADAVNMLPALERHAGTMGKIIDPESVIKAIVETFSDPDGERLIDSMEKAGIDITVICAVDNFNNKNLTAAGMQAYNKQLSDITRHYPGGVLALAGVDPRRPEAPDMLKQCFEEFGVVGLKYHTDRGYLPAGKESYRLLEVLEKYRGILLTHTGPVKLPGRSGLTEMGLLSDIAVDFPEIKVIAAHMGKVNWRPFANLAAHQPNLYGDLATWDAYGFGHYELFCRELRDLMDYAGADKVLFATDDPVFTPLRPTREWVKIIKELPENSPAGIKFTREEVSAILGGNAARILGIQDIK